MSLGDDIELLSRAEVTGRVIRRVHRGRWIRWRIERYGFPPRDRVQRFGVQAKLVRLDDNAAITCPPGTVMWVSLHYLAQMSYKLEPEADALRVPTAR